MTIRLSNGYPLDNVVANGALGFDGKGYPWENILEWLRLIEIDRRLLAITIRTLTMEKRQGNLRWYNPLVVIPLPGGVINSVGLRNPGLKGWWKEYAPNIDWENLNLINSIYSDNTDELVEMIKIMDKLPFKAHEINFSCPNVKMTNPENTHFVIESCRRLKEVSSLPIIAKLSIKHDYLRIVEKIKDYVEAISINSVPEDMFKNSFIIRHFKRLGKGNGGVSGEPAQRFTWEMAQKISDQGLVPVIWPSAWTYDDYSYLKDKVRADAISVGGRYLLNPGAQTRWIKKWEKENNSKNR